MQQAGAGADKGWGVRQGNDSTKAGHGCDAMIVQHVRPMHLGSHLVMHGALMLGTHMTGSHGLAGHHSRIWPLA
jgi:hypothetical protein